MIQVPKAQSTLQNMLRDFPLEPGMKPSAVVEKYWSIYKNPKSIYEKHNNSLNGGLFEELIILVLKMQGILPFYVQANVAFVNVAQYDIIIYTKEIGPISLSLKTSLRERWKQAEFEAQILRGVHRKSESYLVTLDEDNEVPRRRVDASDIVGLDAFVLAGTRELDALIEHLKHYHPIEAPIVKVVDSSRIIPDTGLSLLKSALTEYPEVTMVLS
jgi:hypothetical protein